MSPHPTRVTALRLFCLTLSPMLCSDLPEAIEGLDKSTLVPFPQFDGSRFRELLDEEMGYQDHTSPGARR